MNNSSFSTSSSPSSSQTCSNSSISTWWFNRSNARFSRVMVPLGLGDFRMGLFIWRNILSNTTHTKLSSTHLLVWAVLVCVMCNFFGFRFSSSVFCKYEKAKKDHKGINAKLERECFKTNWEKNNKETWVVCSATNNNRRRKRKGLYGSHAGCMFASCPGDRFFLTTQWSSIFLFLGFLGWRRDQSKSLIKFYRTQQQQEPHKDFKLHINVELTPYDVEKYYMRWYFSSIFIYLSFYLTSLLRPMQCPLTRR